MNVKNTQKALGQETGGGFQNGCIVHVSLAFLKCICFSAGITFLSLFKNKFSFVWK